MSTSALTRPTVQPTTSVRRLPAVGTYTGTASGEGSYTGTPAVVGAYTGRLPRAVGSCVRTQR